MTKQEAIAKAYGEHWETVKNHVDENGWVKTWDLIQILGIVPKDGFEVKIKGKKIKHQDNLHRPKSLTGIETNNVWIKIESEADLPKAGMTNYFICVNGKPSIQVHNLRQVLSLYSDGMITHYQPIVKPEPPIY